MKVLVTGATGVYGRDLTDRLLRSGHEVVAMARREPAVLREIEWTGASGDARWFDVHVYPQAAGGVSLGASITFTERGSTR